MIRTRTAIAVTALAGALALGTGTTALAAPSRAPLPAQTQQQEFHQFTATAVSPTDALAQARRQMLDYAASLGGQCSEVASTKRWILGAGHHATGTATVYALCSGGN